MKLVQYRDAHGARALAAAMDDKVFRLAEVNTTFELANEAIESGRTLVQLVDDHITKERIDLAALETQGRLLPPLDHPVPTRCWVTGAAPAQTQSAGEPAWFFKGDGSIVVAAGQPLPLPPFASGCGLEAGLVGLYVMGEAGTPFRVGFCLGNDFTDHALLSRGDRYLGAAKLRHAPLGAELLTGALPPRLKGSALIRRADRIVWQKPFDVESAAFASVIASVEAQHFAHPFLRRPGNVHAHFLGAFASSGPTDEGEGEGETSQEGDVLEVGAAAFGLPLRNVVRSATGTASAVQPL